jgi:hypothetical protein
MKRSWQIVVTAAVLLVAAGWLGVRWQHNPNRAFWDMLANNLATPGVTRVLQQTSQGLSVSQYTQLNFGAHPTAHALTVFTQNGGTIATEEISDATHDFVRYQKIITPRKTAAGKPLDVSGVVGKWARLDPGGSFGSTVSSGLFDQSLFGILPIANLDSTNRVRLLDYMHTTDVFSYDADKVKTAAVDGHRVYEYQVSIKPAPYVALMQHFGKLVGAKEYDTLDPNDYGSAAAIAVMVAVDTTTHQLVELEQTATGQLERYQAFGAITPVALPHATLTTSELERRITTLQ